MRNIQKVEWRDFKDMVGETIDRNGGQFSDSLRQLADAIDDELFEGLEQEQVEYLERFKESLLTANEVVNSLINELGNDYVEAFQGAAIEQR